MAFAGLAAYLGGQGAQKAALQQQQVQDQDQDQRLALQLQQQESQFEQSLAEKKLLDAAQIRANAPYPGAAPSSGPQAATPGAPSTPAPAPPAAPKAGPTAAPLPGQQPATTGATSAYPDPATLQRTAAQYLQQANSEDATASQAANAGYTGAAAQHRATAAALRQSAQALMDLAKSVPTQPEQALETAMGKPLPALPRSLTQISPNNGGKAPAPGSVAALQAAVAHDTQVLKWYSSGNGGNVDDPRVKALAEQAKTQLQIDSDALRSATTAAQRNVMTPYQRATLALRGAAAGQRGALTREDVIRNQQWANEHRQPDPAVEAVLDGALMLNMTAPDRMRTVVGSKAFQALTPQQKINVLRELRTMPAESAAESLLAPAPAP